MLFPFPSADEQQEIAKTIAQFDDATDGLSARVAQAVDILRRLGASLEG